MRSSIYSIFVRCRRLLFWRLKVDLIIMGSKTAIFLRKRSLYFLILINSHSIIYHLSSVIFICYDLMNINSLEKLLEQRKILRNLQ